MNEFSGTPGLMVPAAGYDPGGVREESHCVGFLTRSVAFFLDLFIVHLAYLCCFLAAVAVLSPWAVEVRLSLLPGLFGAALLTGASFPFFVGVYFWLMHAWQGQTVGKMLLGIRVETIQGGEVGPGISFLRCLGFVLSALPFGLGLCWCLIDREKRGWHDHLAVTRVVAVWK